MNDVIVFSNEDLGSVRTINRNGEPWFVANDVCRALEIARSQTRRLDNDEKDVHIVNTPGGDQQVSIINESGLYTLVLGSRKPQAHAFKRWITHEVIPAIRKTGRYSARPGITIDPDALTLIISTTVAETVKQLLPLIREPAQPPPRITPEAPKRRTRNPVLLRDFEHVLHKVMEEQQVSGNEVAKRMEVGRSTVSDWKNGRHQPNRNNYLRFVMEFNVPVSDLGKGVFE
jgi:prophage antirepressor-like protein